MHKNEKQKVDRRSSSEKLVPHPIPFSNAF